LEGTTLSVSLPNFIYMYCRNHDFTAGLTDLP